LSAGRGFWFSVAIDLILAVPGAVHPGSVGAAGEHLPEGGCLLAVNHLSYADTIVDNRVCAGPGAGAAVSGQGGAVADPGDRWVLAAASIFRCNGAAPPRWTPTGTPWRRSAWGECVVFYPESTYTRDPDGWPMPGMNGLARVALRSGRAGQSR